MGSSKSKEKLPLLREQWHEFVVYSNNELCQSIARLFTYVNTYEEGDNHVTLFRYKSHLIKMVCTESADYIKGISIPSLITYNAGDRMSWYKALDIVKHVKGDIILVSYSMNYRRRSVCMDDICQINIDHYDIDDNNSMKDIISTILEKHILCVPETSTDMGTMNIDK